MADSTDYRVLKIKADTKTVARETARDNNRDGYEEVCEKDGKKLRDSKKLRDRERQCETKIETDMKRVMREKVTDRTKQRWRQTG